MKNLKSILAIAAIVLSASSINAQSVTGRSSVAVNETEPFSVKYLGNDGDYLLFEVVAKTKDKSMSSFEIGDKEEGELYATTYTEKVKRQILKIEKRDNQELSFKLVSGKTTYTKSFVINNVTEAKTTISEANITML